MTSTPSPGADSAELLRALAVLCEMPGTPHPGIASALGIATPTVVGYTDLFVHQLAPYASIYLDPSGKIGGVARDKIAGFWRAIGMSPPAEPDHLASLLGLAATLTEVAEAQDDEARRRLADHSVDALVWEHLVSWLTPYLTRVREIGSTPFPDWAELVEEVTLRRVNPGTDLPGHLSATPEPPRRPEDLITYLLAPVRSGLIITRTDLHRAASHLELGIRIGERAFSLQSLLDQDRIGVLGWLATEAERQATLVQGSPAPVTVKQVWITRARTTARVCADEDV